MSKILEFLRDPSWWFSAFFMAIFASILAAFLKDLISGILSLFSFRYRKWNKKQISTKKRYIKRISQDSTLLIISFIMGMKYMIMFSISCIMYALTPLIGDLMVRNPEAVYSFLGNKPGVTLYVMRTFSMLFAVIAMFSGYVSVSELILSNKAYRLYKNSKLRQARKKQ